MKAVKYCDYQRCKNYKRRDRKYCYVHERKLNSTSTSTVSLPIVLTITFITVMLSMYMYVEDVNVYVNSTIKLVESYKYEKYALEIINLVTNVSEKYVELYNNVAVSLE